MIPLKRLDQEAVYQVVRPYLEEIASCIQDGYSSFFTTFDGLLHKIGTQAKTRLIYDGIAEQVKSRFSKDGGARVIPDQNESIYLLIEDQIALRFKKFKYGLTSNVQTRKVSNFDAQQEVELIPNTVHLYAGYQPDKIFRKIESMLLLCPCATGIKWRLRLIPDEYTKTIVSMAGFNTIQESILQPKIKIKGEDQNAAQSQQ